MIHVALVRRPSQGHALTIAPIRWLRFQTGACSARVQSTFGFENAHFFQTPKSCQWTGHCLPVIPVSILSPGPRNWALLNSNDVTIKSHQYCVAVSYRFIDLTVSPLRCTSSGLSLLRITAVLLITNPPVVAVTLQCTTLAAHMKAMKRKSDTPCHA
jgi:hypothetical protein